MDVQSLKVTELKDELNKRGLSTAGLKQELADRLQDAITDKDQPDSGTAQAAPAESEPIGDPSKSAKGDPRSQTTPPAVKKAEENDSVPIGAAEMKEQVLGDTDGDLGDAMKEAEEEGKQERKMDEVQGVDEHKDEEGITVQSNVQNGEKQLQGVKEVEAGDKRKRNDGDDSMEVEESAKKARTGGAEMQVDSRTEDEATSVTEPVPEPTSEPATITAPVPPRDPFEDIPNPLPHTQHPPTKAIYIDNLRRPLDMPGLKDLLEESGELDDSEVSGGIWVSGVKSHVYAVFKTVDDATKAGLALHHLEFQPIAKTRLYVEFVPSTLVSSLISQEEAAWKDGRKQMSLVIQTVPLGQGYDGSSRKVTVVQAKTGGNVPGRRVPGLAHAPPPPTPFRARPGVAGIGGAAVVPSRTTGAVNSILIGQAANTVAGKGMTSAGPARQVVAPVKPERETRGFMRTRTRPVLFYREAPRK